MTKPTYETWEDNVLQKLTDLEALEYMATSDTVTVDDVLRAWYNEGFPSARVANKLNQRLALNRAKLRPPSMEELKKRFQRMTRSVVDERKQREWVFRNDMSKRDRKVAEMQTLLEYIIWMKDLLKVIAADDTESAAEQPALFPLSTEPTPHQNGY